MKIFLGFLLLIFSLFQSTNILFSSITFYFIINVIIFLLLLLYKVFRKEEIYYSKYWLFFLFWLIYAVVSILWIEDYFLYYRSLIVITTYLLQVIVWINILDSTKNIYKMIKILSILFIFVNLISWFEIFSGTYLFSSSENIPLYRLKKYPLFSFYNVNDLATFLNIGFIIFAYNILYWSKGLYKKIQFVFLVSTVILIILTESRANLLGTIVSITMIFYLNIGTKRLKKYKNFVIVGTALGLFSFIIIFINTQTFSELFNKLVTQQEGSDQLRMNLIKNGLLYLREHKYMGTGAGNLEFFFNNKQYFWIGTIRFIHNWWLEILVTYGVIVFVLYVWIFYRMISNAVIVIRRGITTQSTLSKFLLTLIVCFIIISFSSSSLLLIKWMFWFHGIILAIDRYTRRELVI